MTVTLPAFRASTLTCTIALSMMFAAGCHSDSVVTPATDSPAMPVLGNGVVFDRFTGELWVRGNVAYTTTWGSSGPAPGNAVKIWDVSGNTPILRDSLIVPSAVTLGDVEVSDDGRLLVVATEFSPGSIMIYDLADPIKPQLITRYTTALTDPGVHTAEVERVNGRLYAFLSVDPRAASSARLVIVDITDPAAPTQVFTQAMGSPFVHDVFVRDGILITALWDDGIAFWDIGGRGVGTVANPVRIGSVITVGGKAHNVWWYRSPAGEMKYVFVGEEGPGAIGSQSSGDIHVVDVSNMSAPREVAFYNLPGAGTHNFSVDETRGILYAAYYNGGVRAIDITGDLAACTPTEKSLNGRCDLRRMGRERAHAFVSSQQVYIWGVQLSGGAVYASDMLHGIWKLGQAP
ncbi:MAG TPA: hypothetical protein VGO75_14210 [Gemmatimonadaceae bacterium]|nr:hypothetical protein [Gemmatimonadaceae bacterium]